MDAIISKCCPNFTPRSRRRRKFSSNKQQQSAATAPHPFKRRSGEEERVSTLTRNQSSRRRLRLSDCRSQMTTTTVASLSTTTGAESDDPVGERSHHRHRHCRKRQPKILVEKIVVTLPIAAEDSAHAVRGRFSSSSNPTLPRSSSKRNALSATKKKYSSTSAFSRLTQRTDLASSICTSNF